MHRWRASRTTAPRATLGEKIAGVAARCAVGVACQEASTAMSSGNMGAECTPILVVHKGRYVAVITCPEDWRSPSGALSAALLSLLYGVALARLIRRLHLCPRDIIECQQPALRFFDGPGHGHGTFDVTTGRSRTGNFAERPCDGELDAFGHKPSASLISGPRTASGLASRLLIAPALTASSSSRIDRRAVSAVSAAGRRRPRGCWLCPLTSHYRSSLH